MERKLIMLLLTIIWLPTLLYGSSDEYYRIEVGFMKTTHITFPSKVKYVDLGSNYLIAGKADETENVIRVKAAYKGFKEETNFSVICEDGSFYMFLVTYNDHPDTLYYEMKPITATADNRPQNQEEVILKDVVGESPVMLNMIIRSIYRKNEREITHLGERKDRIEATIRGIYVHNDIMYLHLYMKNTGNISYDIDDVKFIIEDKKKLKRTASQKMFVAPVRQYNGDRAERINPRQAYHIVYAFRKFTISPDKILLLEIMEKNGGRNLNIVVKHSDLIGASPVKNVGL